MTTPNQLNTKLQERKRIRDIVEGMMPTKENIGNAPGDNAVGSEHRSFGRKTALDEVLKQIDV